MKAIYFTVTNDLNFDQRMIRICSSLQSAGYSVTLVGRASSQSPALGDAPFSQKRIYCRFSKGWLFYAEFNFRLLFFLLGKKIDLICAIDLDTILPCYLTSKLKSIPRVYDAHELFCEMKEIVTRPRIYRAWKRIEKMAVPKYRYGYTVNHQIASEFQKMYGVQYEVIRNLPHKDTVHQLPKQKFILYQGAVNEGRSFETLIPAMQKVNADLLIYGDGNYMNQTRELIQQLGLQQKVLLKGKLPPSELKRVTGQAYVGLTLFEKNGLSNYYSLANRFFDYIQAGTPQVCIDFPAYHEINEKYQVALMVPDTQAENIARALNNLLSDEVLYNQLVRNCRAAAMELNWENEEQKLLAFYNQILQ